MSGKGAYDGVGSGGRADNLARAKSAEAQTKHQPQQEVHLPTKNAPKHYTSNYR